jgi:hypothetical protein
MTNLYLKKIFKLAFAGVFTIFVLSSCSSIGNKIGDSFMRSLLSNYVGENYTQIANTTVVTRGEIAITDILSPPRVKIIGELLYDRQLKSGNRIYVHLLPQTKSKSRGFGFSVAYGATKISQRFDILAFLVNTQGTIIDYGHGRYNTKLSCAGAKTRCSQQEIEDTSAQVAGLIVTSSGRLLSAWK